ncbi:GLUTAREDOXIN-C9 [Salix koriyanagi]|uniref:GLUTAREDOXIN-C9 n=1 Tax=Salix koriyanagi TaxID=2511006 RepID=A0A9Q0UEM1_9ROSI|nr:GLUTAREDOXIN-C9 [Salix koriyanagi]
MCHVVKLMLLGLGVNPTVFEVEEKEEDYVIKALSMINGDKGGKSGDQLQFPVVFVGGKLFGGLERVMATHITGELVPILKDAGALWL